MGILAEFDDKLWLVMVDHVVAYPDRRLVFQLTTDADVEGGL